MKCKICASSNIQSLEEFKPYTDKEWKFQMYECLDCLTRFVIREEGICYHEELHSIENSPYKPHYDMAEAIKNLLDKDLNGCREILIKKSPVIEQMLNYIEGKDKNISILEIGCSTGYVVAYLQKIGYTNSLGIDISASAINYASSMFGDFYSLEENTKKYDVIFHTGLIGCVDNPLEFLNYYLDLLADKGIMYFNAPDVDSVREVNEIWVSTPPPDLMYLFEKSVFSKILNKKYKVSITKTISPIIILRKYINQFKKQKNNIYPKRFYLKPKNNIKPKNSVFKEIVSSIVRLLVYMKVIKYYSDNYGLIVKIEKND